MKRLNMAANMVLAIVLAGVLALTVIPACHGAVTPLPHPLLLEERQARFAEALGEFEIVAPRKTTADGDFVSHHLDHHFDAPSVRDQENQLKKKRRRRRSVGEFEDTGATHDLHYTLDLEGITHRVSLKPNHNFIAPHAIVERGRSWKGKPQTSASYNTSRRLHADEDHLLKTNKGNVLEFVDNKQCHYQGFVHNHTESIVALSACDGLRGFIRTDNDEYLIEPVRGHVRQRRSLEPHPHLVYKRSVAAAAQKADKEDDSSCSTADSYEEALRNREAWEEEQAQLRQSRMKGRKCPEGHECQPAREGQGHEWWTLTPEVVAKVGNGIPEADQGRAEGEKGQGNRRSKRSSSSRRRRKRSVSMERNVEVLVVADKEMVDYYTNEDLKTYILTVMNMVSTIYHDATLGNAVNIIVVRIFLLEDVHYQEELQVSHHADNTLQNFCEWQMIVNPSSEEHPYHHDVAVLITRYNICSKMTDRCSTLGVAEIAGMCQPLRSCNVNEDTGLQIAYTISHEVGHNFGMPHDGPHNGCKSEYGITQHVMAPHISTDVVPFSWSSCSRTEITNFLDREWGKCLNDEPTELEYEFPALPPGAMYDADHQCRLIYGPSAKHCNGIELVCQALWCQIEHRCISRLEPAAEGTQCEKHKWCSSGKCVTMGERPAAIHGSWGEWSDWSPCSRTCGAGVEVAIRPCNNPPPSNGGSYCTGDRKRYRICNTQDCPENGVSFRAVQCSEYDSKPYKGKNVTWLPVLADNSPCELHCKPSGQFVSVLMDETVVDGTPCRPGTRDMCINGVCKRVACDWTIEGTAQEDRCGLCHGDGTQCVTYRGVFNKTIGSGYTEVVSIPKGARNIKAEETDDAANYFAVKDAESDEYFLNGGWLIQWSGEYSAHGLMMYYRRTDETEQLFMPGPIKTSIAFMLLFQTNNPGVRWEYTIPHENVTYTPVFDWAHADWDVCSVTCGSGTQVSRVRCLEQEAGLVEDRYCRHVAKPRDMSRSCNDHACPAWWWAGPWQPCSTTCGSGGLRRRSVMCVRSFGPTEQMALLDSDCESDEKPHEIEKCPEADPCPLRRTWIVGPWEDTCGSDPCELESRTVTCLLPSGDCDPLTKPPEQRQCGNITCGVWKTAEWSECSSDCGGEGVQLRSVWCEDGIACRERDEPMSIRECNGTCVDSSSSSKAEETRLETGGWEEKGKPGAFEVKKWKKGRGGVKKEDSTSPDVLSTSPTLVAAPAFTAAPTILMSSNGTSSIDAEGEQTEMEESEEKAKKGETEEKNGEKIMLEGDDAIQDRKNGTVEGPDGDVDDDSPKSDKEESSTSSSLPPPLPKGVRPTLNESDKDVAINAGEDENEIEKGDEEVEEGKEKVVAPPQGERMDGEVLPAGDTEQMSGEEKEEVEEKGDSPVPDLRGIRQEEESNSEVPKKDEGGSAEEAGKEDEEGVMKDHKDSQEEEATEPKPQEIKPELTGLRGSRPAAPEDPAGADDIISEDETNIGIPDREHEEEEEEKEEDNSLPLEEERPMGIAEDKIPLEEIEVIEIIRRKNKKRAQETKKVKIHTGKKAVRVLKRIAEKEEEKMEEKKKLEEKQKMEEKKKKIEEEKKLEEEKKKLEKKQEMEEEEESPMKGILDDDVLRKLQEEMEEEIRKMEEEEMFQKEEEEEEVFRWRVGNWSECSTWCGQGIQHRPVECVDLQAGATVAPDSCASVAPNDTKTCSQGVCEDWQIGDWGECEGLCGEGEISRDVVCPEGLRCDPDTRPDHAQSCDTGKPCVSWVKGPWSMCTRSCGIGYQIRHVKCVDARTQSALEECQMEKPSHKRKCNIEECPESLKGQARECQDRMDSKLCGRLRHMCSTKFFRIKCCKTCLKNA
ncbi:ADAM metallopeptidase with thrombospondin type 1 motif B [Oratosquilla oratoria]|uniref:ADAM metallopeptidase with thrombospondin type 1 motif B n=1 Tax=Oratosquilla oratoria TaxID=337810 RepID=UPI003F76C343